MPMGGAIAYNEPLDPFLADAVKRQRKMFQQSNHEPDAKRSMLQEIMLAMLPQLMSMGVENVFKLAQSRQRAAEPMTPMEQAQMRNVDADTKYKEAQTTSRSEENDPAIQMRNPVAMEHLKTGDVAGAQAIAAGKMAPGQSPVMVERAREAQLGRARAAIEAARKNTNPREAIGEATAQIGSIMDEVRQTHGSAGEGLARDVGEVGNEYLYGERGDDKEMINFLAQQIITNKERQFGKGQAGVTQRDIAPALRSWTAALGAVNPNDPPWVRR